MTRILRVPLFAGSMISAMINRQLVVEYAYVGLLDSNDRSAEHGAGIRFQQNPTNAWLFHADAMYGFRTNDDALSGVRMELRYKF
jgi:hypothetical protein